MSTYNKVILVGHLGGDPVIRTLENLVKVADFSIATNEVFQKNGESKESLDWHDIVAWRRLADFSEVYLKKGSKVMIEGKLKTSSWMDKETGAKRRSIFIQADQIRFMDKKDSSTAIHEDAHEGLEGGEHHAGGAGLEGGEHHAEHHSGRHSGGAGLESFASRAQHNGPIGNENEIGIEMGNEAGNEKEAANANRRKSKKSVQNLEASQHTMNGIMGGFSEHFHEEDQNSDEETAESNARIPF